MCEWGSQQHPQPKTSRATSGTLSEGMKKLDFVYVYLTFQQLK